MIYTIASDTGKKRMNPDATLRHSYTWSTFAILSCECSLEEKIRSEGGEWRAGMAVRFPDIDVTEVNRAVDRATLTAIHGLHILAGVIPILGLAYFSKKKDMSGETEMVGLYWHFVDLVWMFIFPLVYLMSTKIS